MFRKYVYLDISFNDSSRRWLKQSMTPNKIIFLILPQHHCKHQVDIQSDKFFVNDTITIQA